MTTNVYLAKIKYTCHSDHSFNRVSTNNRLFYNKEDALNDVKNFLGSFMNDNYGEEVFGEFENLELDEDEEETWVDVVEDMAGRKQFDTEEGILQFLNHFCDEHNSLELEIQEFEI